jgi:thioredoxin 1
MLKTFTKEIESQQEGTYLVKFGAPWCGPCRQLAPIMEALDEEGYKVFEVNVDEEQDLTSKYGIRSVPTTLVFKNKELVQTIVGVKSKQDLINLFA